MSRADSAAENIAGAKMNCSQSVITAYCEELGLDRKLALKVALGFGGGMGRTGKTCGAVTGAYMVLGLRQNPTPETAVQVKDKAYALVKEFNRRFIEKNGTLNCKELIGCDLSTPEGAAYFKEKGLSAAVCSRFVHDAVEILEEMNNG
jgi:C_GCAxxG_C_C family probable redox protein